MRDLLAQALGALAREGVHSGGAGDRRRSSARSAPSTATSRRTSRSRSRRAPASRRARWPRRSSRACRRARTRRSRRPTSPGPGFINLRLVARVLAADAARRSSPRATTGAGGAARATPKIVLEYLSANPTGPITVAHGRHAAVGDSMTRLLRFAGYPVTPEYYINDAGNQVEMLTLSVWTRYMETARAADPSVPEVVFPENGYKGEYIRGFGRDLFARDGKRWVGPRCPPTPSRSSSSRWSARSGMIRATLARFDVTFEVWQSERALHDAGDVARDAARAGREGLHRSPRRRRLAEDDRAVGRRQGPRRREVGRAADVPAGGHRVPPQEAGARLRRALRHLGLRPPRPHRAHAGGAEGVRLRPRRCCACS